MAWRVFRDQRYDRKSGETMRRIATFRSPAETLAVDEHCPTDRVSASRAEGIDRDDLPVTAALLRASRAVSFATPGHRRGRSCDPGR